MKESNAILLKAKKIRIEKTAAKPNHVFEIIAYFLL